MLATDEKVQPGFEDFPNFAQGSGLADREAIFEAREFSKPTRGLPHFRNPPGDFAKAVTQGWCNCLNHLLFLAYKSNLVRVNCSEL